MGLQERRLIKQLQEETLPAVISEIETLCGAGIEWNVDWDSLSTSMESLGYVNTYGFQTVLQAFKNICIDDMGKEAIRDGVKRVVLKKVKDISEMKQTFENGVLEIHALWEGSGWEGYPNEEKMRTMMENAL